MRIAALVANAIPDHLAGAERALHDTLEWLAARGHECCVLARNGAVVPRDEGGVRVVGQRTPGQAAALLEASDVVFTQLEDAMFAQIVAVETQTPLVFYAHSPTQLEGLGVMPGACQLVLHNSKHVADAGAWWPGESMILHPPVFSAKYRVEPLGQCVTMIGMSHRKGVMQFMQAARDLPALRFLGVQGAYDQQIIDAGGLIELSEHQVKKGNIGGMPENITCGPPIPDVRPVYANTRVLLVLSEHESWGRVANEAAVSGIPSIMHWEAAGLLEMCGLGSGNGGILVDRDDSRMLANAIRGCFEDEAAWRIRSEYALEMAAELDPEPALKRLERKLKQIVKAKPTVSLS